MVQASGVDPQLMTQLVTVLPLFLAVTGLAFKAGGLSNRVENLEKMHDTAIKLSNEIPVLTERLSNIKSHLERFENKLDNLECMRCKVNGGDNAG